MERSNASPIPPRIVLKACSRIRSKPSRRPLPSKDRLSRSRRVSRPRRSVRRSIGRVSFMSAFRSPPPLGVNGWKAEPMVPVESNLPN